MIWFPNCSVIGEAGWRWWMIAFGGTVERTGGSVCRGGVDRVVETSLRPYLHRAARAEAIGLDTRTLAIFGPGPATRDLGRPVNGGNLVGQKWCGNSVHRGDRQAGSGPKRFAAHRHCRGSLPRCWRGRASPWAGGAGWRKPVACTSRRRRWILRSSFFELQGDAGVALAGGGGHRIRAGAWWRRTPPAAWPLARLVVSGSAFPVQTGSGH